MTAALFYHPEAYSTAGPRLMGRHAAGESFLRGFLMHSRAEAFWALVPQASDADSLVATVRSLQRPQPVRVIEPAQLPALAQPGVLYHPGPDIVEAAWQRATFGHAAWSLCGVTHTTSSARAMDALTGLLTGPVQPWDAVICTSTAVKDNVTRLLQAQADYLRQRLGITRLVLPQCPVIPLGIHTQDFVFTGAQRAKARQALQAGDDTLVALFMGRLSFHAKAHPLAMYQALQAASQRSGRPVVLVECGWHGNEFIAAAYEAAAAQACPGVRVVTLDGRQAASREVAWAGADVFCSLSDNIQETFGLAPVEAMAAGLPVVVSDWDGYRDTVRHGVDGFRIATLMPQAGLAGDLATRHALALDTYDMYCGHTCSLVAVDVEQATQAFEQLFESAELRRRLGEAGRERARTVYDWAAIIPRYEALWAELADIRRAQGPQLPPLAQAWPARMDPFHAFAAYPTRALTPDTMLVLRGADPQAVTVQARAWRALAMVEFARWVLPSDAEIQVVIHAAAAGPQRAEALVEGIDPARRPQVFRGLAWLLKMGVLQLA